MSARFVGIFCIYYTKCIHKKRRIHTIWGLLSNGMCAKLSFSGAHAFLLRGHIKGNVADRYTGVYIIRIIGEAEASQQRK